MASPEARRKFFAVTPWVLIFVLAAVNTLLIKQNLETRAQLEVLQEKLNPASWSLHPGDMAQPFSASELNGEPYNVEYQKDARTRVFFFFNPHCPYCAQQIPYWRDVLNNIDANRFEVIGLTGDREDRQEVLNYVKESGFLTAREPLRVVFISDNVLRSYKLASTPTTLLVSGDGRVENIWVGRWDTEIAASAGSALNVPLH
jgi:peroxiredoxin